MEFLNKRRLECRLTHMSFGDNKEGVKFATFTVLADVVSTDKSLPASMAEGIKAMERNSTVTEERFSEKITSQNISFFTMPEQKRSSENFTGIDLENIMAVRPRRGWNGGNAKTIPKVLLQFCFTLPFEYVDPKWAFRTYRSTFFVDLGECQGELPMDGKGTKSAVEGDEGEE